MRRQDAGRQRDRDDVVAGGPPEVLHHLSVVRPAERDDSRDIPRVAPDQDDVAGLDGDVRTGAYRDGDVIVVSPGTPIRRGDRVVVKTSGGEVVVKELKRRTAKTLELASLNPSHVDRTLAAGDVEWIARIVWASQ